MCKLFTGFFLGRIYGILQGVFPSNIGLFLRALWIRYTDVYKGVLMESRALLLGASNIEQFIEEIKYTAI